MNRLESHLNKKYENPTSVWVPAIFLVLSISCYLGLVLTILNGRTRDFKYLTLVFLVGTPLFQYLFHYYSEKRILGEIAQALNRKDLS
jgi:hypothetical protein